MKENFKKYVSFITVAGVLIGAALGYLYYSEVGCKSGSCKIASNPWISTIWGAVMGYLLSDIIKGWKNKGNRKPTENTNL